MKTNEIDRREAVKALALIPFAFNWDITAGQLQRVSAAMTGTLEQRAAFVPRFFTRSEWRTVRMLVDYIIPSDERSGAATDAKVPEYMDFLLADPEASDSSKTAMRGGLGWIDFECVERFGTNFVKSTDGQRKEVLNDIAWPSRAAKGKSQGVAFFNRFRDMTASGFFSSEMGWRDVRFVGNVFNPNWNGCPPEALAKLGVSKDLMNTRVPVE